MNKKYFLSSTFLLTSLWATPEAPNYTYGIPPEKHEQIKKELGVGWPLVIKYLSATTEKIEIDVRNNSWKVWAFHKQNIKLESAPLIAQMKACETCPELGSLVNSSPELRSTFSKISAAYDRIEEERIKEESAAQKIRLQKLNADAQQLNAYLAEEEKKLVSLNTRLNKVMREQTQANTLSLSSLFKQFLAEKNIDIETFFTLSAESKEYLKGFLKRMERASQDTSFLE